MPKMKSHSGVNKRFKKTGSGKIRRGQINTSHLLEKKSSKRKRRLSGDQDVSSADAPRINKMLGS